MWIAGKIERGRPEKERVGTRWRGRERERKRRNCVELLRGRVGKQSPNLAAISRGE